MDRDVVLQALPWAIGALVAIWFVCSGLYPYLCSGADWSAVQGVWHRWQGWNVGVMALLASGIALWATKVHERREAAACYHAALLPLPQHLDALTIFCRNTIQWLAEAADANASGRGRVPAGPAPTVPPQTGAFLDCVRYAPRGQRKSINRIFAGLQVHSARLRDILDRGDMDQDFAIREMANVSVVQAHVDRLFPHVRDAMKFNTSALTEKECFSVIRLAGIDPRRYPALVSYVPLAVSYSNK